MSAALLYTNRVTEHDQIETVLRYWFGELEGPTDVDRSKNPLWWSGSEAIDADIRERFGELVEQACAGALSSWAESARGALALVILLDQFTRNLGRGTGEAYKGDAKALAVCEQAIAQGLDNKLRPIERGFLYMPMMHAEDQDIALRSIDIYTQLSNDIDELGVEGYPNSLAHALTHAKIVLRFGRYPHRNELLGRDSSAQELAFMADGGPNFGQAKKS